MTYSTPPSSSSNQNCSCMTINCTFSDFLMKSYGVYMCFIVMMLSNMREEIVVQGFAVHPAVRGGARAILSVKSSTSTVRRQGSSLRLADAMLVDAGTSAALQSVEALRAAEAAVDSATAASPLTGE